MRENNYIQGNLFTQDYLMSAIRKEPEYSGADADGFIESLNRIYGDFPIDTSPNESQTENDVIWPILRALGWDSFLTQQSLAVRGRINVPDGLLFIDERAKKQANEYSEEWKRYEFGTVLVECKRWERPLDRKSVLRHERTTPSTQMLRYLRQIDDLTNGSLRWGILTNGSVWRLYYQGARSVSEQYFQVNLYSLYQTLQDPLFDDASTSDDLKHAIKLFYSMFHRDSFVSPTSDKNTFHIRSIDEGMNYEERVRKTLSNKVFDTIFPMLVDGIYRSVPGEDLETIRHSALILLYRLLFVFYAEDRSLLPVHDSRYEQYGLRKQVRHEIGTLLGKGRSFSETAPHFWNIIANLSNAINGGDNSIGLPPYNGGLFDPEQTPILSNITLPDSIIAQVVDLLSFEQSDGLRRYINYRDLSVQQLGYIYERLLEFELYLSDDNVLSIRPNTYARKSTGSYFTPDYLVQLIIRETVEPLIEDKMEMFRIKVNEIAASSHKMHDKLDMLKGFDPAEEILNLKICDPAMGSGHFLVNLVDYLTDRVIEVMAEAESLVDYSDDIDYVSPLSDRIHAIRTTIVKNAKDNDWSVDVDQLDDPHIIRRMVLKRCLYGVDKNEMAVELAKLSLWLHTFTVGAPLSFLDHHLRCGNSLFGADISRTLDRVSSGGSYIFLHESLKSARESANAMQQIENLTDAEIAEAHRSSDIFNGITRMTEPLNCFLRLLHAIDWLNVKDKEGKAAINLWLGGQFGDAFAIASNKMEPTVPDMTVNLRYTKNFPSDPERAVNGDYLGQALRKRFVDILKQCFELIQEEKFFTWQIAFPGIWKNWETQPTGGFDAIVGNPPWDRVKLQQTWWFIMRSPGFDKSETSAERDNLVAKLSKLNPSLDKEYQNAMERAKSTARMARNYGDYPMLSSGDVNLYSLFVERGMALLRSNGLLGLLVPSGIASDKTSSEFFQTLSTSGRLKCLYDFENKRNFFPDVHSSFKFCAFVASKMRQFEHTRCSFFLHNLEEIEDKNKSFVMRADDFDRVNPNTGTMPIFRTRRDAELTIDIYERMPVLVDSSDKQTKFAFPVKYVRMFDVANDSDKFRSYTQLVNDYMAWPITANVMENRENRWLPLYVGRMIQQYDHRYASVGVNSANVYRTSVSKTIDTSEKVDPQFCVTPKHWVSEYEIQLPPSTPWLLAFRDITSATNMRTMVASAIPFTAVGNSAPILLPANSDQEYSDMSLLLANLNSIIFDFVARQKVQSTHFSWYILQQMPIVDHSVYASVFFGKRSVGDIIKESVLELCYTSNDMGGFARSLGFTNPENQISPPFGWCENRRLHLRAKLDAIYFLLYGVFDVTSVSISRDNISYIYSTFPSLQKQERSTYGEYKTRNLALAYCNSLASGIADNLPDA